MRRTYLTVLTTVIETEGFRHPLRDKPLSETERTSAAGARAMLESRPGLLPSFARRDPLDQNNAATYLSALVLEGMCKEDSRDSVLDVRSYALGGECIGKDNEAHTLVTIHGQDASCHPVEVYWCNVCGALKVNGVWEFPEIRIDRKEK